MARAVPRPFELHWGAGEIVEEASFSGEHHEPALQLLEFEDKSVSVRMCWYDHRGRFQRSPLIVGDSEVEGLRASLEKMPRLRAFLGRLVN
ncbi:MAG: hypothetical protein IH957_11790 [Chloroflexi bacterium]|nr:hypothetical protein [Chloroflexota bacterium]